MRSKYFNYLFPIFFLYKCSFVSIFPKISSMRTFSAYGILYSLADAIKCVTLPLLFICDKIVLHSLPHRKIDIALKFTSLYFVSKEMFMFLNTLFSFCVTFSDIIYKTFQIFRPYASDYSIPCLRLLLTTIYSVFLIEDSSYILVVL